jgi:hypothetical protein
MLCHQWIALPLVNQLLHHHMQTMHKRLLIWLQALLQMLLWPLQTLRQLLTQGTRLLHHHMHQKLPHWPSLLLVQRPMRQRLIRLRKLLRQRHLQPLSKLQVLRMPLTKL